MSAAFADYIVFVDESGDHSLTSIDADFPVFALAFCIVEKADYIAKIVPEMQALKFKYWGHDAIVLHEHDIRKEKGEFAFLRQIGCCGMHFTRICTPSWSTHR